jgi:hypothetical protein
MNPDSPELSLFRVHLEEAPFIAGIDAGRWSLLANEDLTQWPYCRIELRSRPAFSADGHVVLRFNLDGYSATAPTAQPWDPIARTALASNRWPKGSAHLNAIFNPNWNTTALYMPCDRVAMSGHDGWKQTFPQWWWTSKHTITDYLTFVSRHLLPTDNE